MRSSASGFDYDLKNIIDLMRYLMPLPVPQRWRRRALALGSGDPTRIICSALIAQAFESVRYPILPKVTRMESRVARREMLEIRHHSLYAPRDFDISPYFAVVKPTIENGFDYKKLHWADLPLPPDRRAVPTVDAGEATLVPQPARRRRRAHCLVLTVALSRGPMAACTGRRSTTSARHVRRRLQSPRADVHAAVSRGAAESRSGSRSCC